MRGWIAVLLLVTSAWTGCIGFGGDTVTDTEADDDPDTASITPSTEDEAASTGDSGPPQTGEEEVARAPPPPQTLQVDPLQPGKFPIALLHYDWGYTIVDDPEAGVSYPAQLNGSIHVPEEGGGPFPVVVLMHGRHTTCRIADGPERLGTTVCPELEPVTEPIDSYTGYQALAQALATNGFIVASVDANDVNDRDNDPAIVGGDFGATARAQLVMRTLDQLAAYDAGSQLADPVGSDTHLAELLRGRVDMERIGLVGHSRGGEGVVRAVTYADEREEGEAHDLDAVFAIAPTDFNDLAAPGVSLAVLLPYCDGDVSNLWGAHIFDRTRALAGAQDGERYQFLAMGSNHNYYNTQWPQDDAAWMDDTYCATPAKDGGGRLSQADQHQQGAALISAFLRAQLTGDHAFRAWLTGQALPPASACPQERSPCPGLVHATHHPTSQNRLMIEDGAGSNVLEENDLGGAVTLSGFKDADGCRPSDCPSQPNRQLTHQLTLTWEDNATYHLEIPPGQGDASDFDAIQVRVGVNFRDELNPATSQDLALVLADATGAWARVNVSDWSQALFHPPGTDDREPGVEGEGVFGQDLEDIDNAKVTLNAVRVPLGAFLGVDTSQLASLTLSFDRTPTGSIQLADLMLVR